MNTVPLDARLVANLILDHLDQLRIPISNLSLQKVLYFVHGHFLAEHNHPLVKDEFEAWQFGPVHRTAYRAFKSFGNGIIFSRAMRFDPFTQTYAKFEQFIEPEIQAEISRHASFYAPISPGELVELSHAQGSPWWNVWENAKEHIDVGLKIPNALIREYFSQCDSRLLGGGRTQ